MICTFGDTTDVVWWRELQLPTRTAIGRDGRLLPEPPDWGPAAPEAERALRRAGGQDRQAGAGSHRRAARGAGRAGRRAEADHAPGEVLRARRSSARDRVVAAVVHPQRRSRRRAAGGVPRAGPRAAVAPVAHAQPLRELGRGPQLATGSSAVSATSACRSRCGTRSTPTARSTTTTRSCPTRPVCRSIPPATSRTGSTEDQRGKAGGFVGRPRRDGHVGDVVAHARARRRLGGRPRPLRPGVPDGPAAAGVRDHPHLAVLDHRARALRVRLVAVDRRRHLGLGARPRPQEDVEEQGQRRHADGTDPPVRCRRHALLGGERAAGGRHRGRRGPDEGRSTPGHQDPQRVEVRAGRHG